MPALGLQVFKDDRNEGITRLRGVAPEWIVCYWVAVSDLKVDWLVHVGFRHVATLHQVCAGMTEENAAHGQTDFGHAASKDRN